MLIIYFKLIPFPASESCKYVCVYGHLLESIFVFFCVFCLSHVGRADIIIIIMDWDALLPMCLPITNRSLWDGQTRQQRPAPKLKRNFLKQARTYFSKPFMASYWLPQGYCVQRCELDERELVINSKSTLRGSPVVPACPLLPGGKI